MPRQPRRERAKARRTGAKPKPQPAPKVEAQTAEQIRERLTPPNLVQSRWIVQIEDGGKTRSFRSHRAGEAEVLHITFDKDAKPRSHGTARWLVPMVNPEGKLREVFAGGATSCPWLAPLSQADRWGQQVIPARAYVAGWRCLFDLLEQEAEAYPDATPRAEQKIAFARAYFRRRLDDPTFRGPDNRFPGRMMPRVLARLVRDRVAEASRNSAAGMALEYGLDVADLEADGFDLPFVGEEVSTDGAA